MRKKYLVQGISFPDEHLFQAAKARAKSQRRTLSNYICGLLEEDIKAAAIGSYPVRHESLELNETPPSSTPASAATKVLQKAAGAVGRRGVK